MLDEVLLSERDLVGSVRHGEKGVLSISRATLLRWVAEGRFPSPIKLGPQRRAWKSSDVRRWIETREPMQTRRAAELEALREAGA